MSWSTTTRIVSGALAALLLPACSPDPTTVAPRSAVSRNVQTVTTVAFTEGPTVDRDGTVYFTDISNDRTMAVGPDGNLSTFRQPANRANGLIFDREWQLLACEGGEALSPRVTRTNMETGEIEVIADSYEGKPLQQPNDLTLDGLGRIYFTDRPVLHPAIERTVDGLGRTFLDNQPVLDPASEQTGVHAVYRVDPDGTIERILTEPEIERPNGIVIAPDDRTLYLIEAHPAEGRARMIRAYDLSEEGTVSNMRVFHDFYPGRSGDGMTIDSEANLYVAAGLNGLRGTSETLDTKSGVHVFSPDGQLKEFIPIPEDTVTNCAFGGPDLKILYVTAGKTLFKVGTNITGTRR